MPALKGEAFGRPFSADPNDWDYTLEAKRTVPIEILVLGPPRTGTSSLVQALRILGYHNIHHMSTCISQPPQNALWHRAVQSKYHANPAQPIPTSTWDTLLGDCQAITDSPSAAFAAELIAAYPEAKVILHTRPVDAWYTSVSETIKPAFQSPLIWLFCLTGDPFWRDWIAMMRAMWTGWTGIPDPWFGFGAPFLEAEEVAKARFLEHYGEIRGLVEKERLFERGIEEGWEGLCGLLGKEAPGCEFPRVNDRVEFGRSIEVMVGAGVKRLGWLVAKAVLAVLVLVGISWMMRG